MMTRPQKGELPYPSGSMGRDLPYPNGWFGLAYSQELPPGGILTRPFMGEEVVLYRTRKGQIQAVRPYCPHLGAHLGKGGRVVDECIVCPFHGFAFATDGTCERTGYGPGSKPPQIRLTKLIVREINGGIFLWHDEESAQPTWEIPDLDMSGFPRLRLRTFTLGTHVQEIGENGIDLGHFSIVHRIENLTTVHPVKFDGPSCSVTFRGTRSFPGLGHQKVVMEIHMYGLGYGVFRASVPRLRFKAVGHGLFTPVAPWRMHFRLGGAATLGGERPSRLGDLVAPLLTRAFLPFASKDLTDDVPIFENKRYLERPKLVKADGPIMEYRRWARQFYPESQPSLDNSASMTSTDRAATVGDRSATARRTIGG